jgi:hypothetical protein
MLKLSIYAQGSRVIVLVLEVGAMKIYVAGVEELGGKRKDRMRLRLPQELKVFSPIECE